MILSKNQARCSYKIVLIKKSVLRLPPYHCEPNQIEIIRGITKNNVADNNTTFNLSDARTLTDMALSSIKQETFEKSCRHAEKI